MTTGKQLAALLLLTTALTCPGVAYAQGTVGSANQQGADTPASPAQDGQATQPADTEPGPDSTAEQPEVSVPGGVILVTGRVNRDPTRSSSQVLSVLSTEQIARTGEGNIAGALGRVTGLSVVGSGFVYVRGLGDRYSLALLNGSPLPSPEPLRRVVPLDLFPTGLIASSLVQKSYSVNYPGEFGGGVINLTTRAIPRDSFLTVGIGGTWDSETTNELGYTYFGSSTDWTGFENGTRDQTPALHAFFRSGERISSGTVDTQSIARELVTGRNAVLQTWRHLPANGLLSFSAGHSFDIGDSTVGVILGGGYSHKFTSRDALQQTSLQADLSGFESNFRRVTTDERIVVNGLVGLGLEIGDNTVRWTNVFIRDTIKHARLGLGREEDKPIDIMQQETAWYERQLIDTQFVAELKPVDGLSLDVRYGYANSQRQAPGELAFEYVRTNSSADPLGAYFVNRLNRNAGSADITFSDLNEDLFSGGIDASYQLIPAVTATLGVAFANTERRSSRRNFLFDAPSTMPAAVGLLRPDLLLQPTNIQFFGISLIEGDESTPAFLAKLDNYAGYAKANIEFTRDVSLDIGVRYETADESVAPIQVFNTASSSAAGTALSNDYWLPAATLTWSVTPELQLRASASKTIARPQFRELIYQPFFDPESNRVYLGNPLLTDSQLYNGEARAEWYFAPGQRVSVSGFYKKIDRPIEAFITQLGGFFTTTYANAPQAQLYGAEFEVQKNFDLDKVGFLPDGERFVLVGNYTFTHSKLEVSPGDQVSVFAASSGNATDYFRNGAPLTGQSDHLVNLQFGLENQNHLSQQTFLLSYASNRVVSRGLNGSPPQPDVIEKPGFGLDFVARQGFTLFGREVEAKIEARNILGTQHREFQQSGANVVEVNTYAVGRTFSGSLSVTF